MEETKIIYHIDEEETPYLVKIPIPPDRIRLVDFKNVLNRPNYKFFFKSMDDDFGVVKEEIVDDEAPLPCFNGRVVSWLVSSEGSNVSDSNSQCGTGAIGPEPLERVGRPLPRGLRALAKPDDTETDSVMSSRRGYGIKLLPSKMSSAHNHRHGSEKKYNRFNYDSSILSSDVDTTTFIESEDDASSRITATTDHSSVSRVLRHNNMMRRQKRRKHKPIAMSRTSSFSSITNSTMSLNIITVNLNMASDDNNPNFLGISIVGESNKGGDGGIYVGSIMKGGAVAKDGRIEPGDMILQVNDVNFENMTNDEAVRVLRDVVSKRGPIKLVVAKCWDPNPKGYFTIPRTEPVRPIDPGAWVAHTTAAISGANSGMSNIGNNEFTLNRAPSISTLSSGSITSSVPETERTVEENGPIRMTTMTPMSIVMREMQKPDSGLEVRDRNWLKITIPNAFIGSELVDWLLAHVEGFADRREAKKYASNLLKSNLIRHTVNKLTFSEQCYYVFDNNFMQLPPISNLTLSSSDHCSQLPLYTPCYDIYSYPTNQQLSESNSSGRSVQLLVDGMSQIDVRSNHSSGAGGHRNNGSSIGGNGEVFVDVM